uniref:Uncharacterized protein n=1 Tax=Aegilops tauschii subsp. strangulata TaxID=200361 RepID=A0A452ZIL9_AEGTS
MVKATTMLFRVMILSSSFTKFNKCRCEASRDAKDVSLRCSLEELMDLSATIFYQAYKSPTPIRGDDEKKLKTEDVISRITNSLKKGSLCWIGTTCLLVHKYGYRVDKSLLISWLQACCQ